MPQESTHVPGQDWLGLTRLAAFLVERQASAGSELDTSTDEEVVDRLYRMLEILALVEEHSQALQAHARNGTDHDAMQLAVELRRLANRLQAVGEFLSNAGQGLIDLEDQILAELDERFREQSTRDYAAQPKSRRPWPALVAVGA